MGMSKKSRRDGLEVIGSGKKDKGKEREKRRDKDKKGKRRDKGKNRERMDVEESEFKLINASLVVSIPPVFANNPRAGVEEMLDSLVMRSVSLPFLPFPLPLPTRAKN